MSYPPPVNPPGSAGPYGRQPGANPYLQPPQQTPQYPAGPPPAPGGPPPGWPPQAPVRQGGGGRRAFGVVLGVFGALGMIGGGALVAHAYNNSRQDIANDEYGNVIWQDEPVDRIFPLTLGGGGYEAKIYDRNQAQWHRMGISQDTACEKALTQHTLEAAQDNGCKAVLRATYVDPTANMVATVAIVVMPSGPPEEGPKDKVDAVYGEHRTTEGAIAPYPVPGTLAAKWKARNGSFLRAVPGENLPYAVGASIGSVDGYVAGNLPGEYGEFQDDQDMDRESWHANAEELVNLMLPHLSRLQRGDV